VKFCKKLCFILIASWSCIHKDGINWIKESSKIQQRYECFLFLLEMESFRHKAQMLLSLVESALPFKLCCLIQDYALFRCYMNINITLHFFWLHVIFVSCERNVSKLQIIKNDLWSCMAEDWLSNLASFQLSIILKRIYFDNVIYEFAYIKARKVIL
jgi:hypothetical protein